MCQVCQAEPKSNDNVDPIDDPTIDRECLAQLEDAAKLYRERAAENDRIINQLFIAACMIGLVLAIFACIYPEIKAR